MSPTLASLAIRPWLGWLRLQETVMVVTVGKLGPVGSQPRALTLEAEILQAQYAFLS